jgi:hypothetical protein
VFTTPRSIAATARWLLALLAFGALAAAPARVSAAIARAAPGGDLCRALHGASPERPTGSGVAPTVVHDCGACAFCAAPVAALPPAAPVPPEATPPAIPPADRASTGHAGWAGILARARGPPLRG